MAKKKEQDEGIKVVCRNKRARFNYSIEEKFEAGIVLSGTEVKSLRQGKGNLVDSYGKIQNGEVWLINAHISPYDFSHYDNHDPMRPRKLLLNKKEIQKLIGKIKEKGLALIPLSIYFKESWAKVELALARGKKDYDKRQDLKQKEADREMSRAMRRGNRDY